MVAIGADAKLDEEDEVVVDDEEEVEEEDEEGPAGVDPSSWGECHSASFSECLLSCSKSLGGIGPNTDAKASLLIC